MITINSQLFLFNSSDVTIRNTISNDKKVKIFVLETIKKKENPEEPNRKKDKKLNNEKRNKETHSKTEQNI